MYDEATMSGIPREESKGRDLATALMQINASQDGTCASFVGLTSLFLESR